MVYLSANIRHRDEEEKTGPGKYLGGNGGRPLDLANDQEGQKRNSASRKACNIEPEQTGPP